MSGPTQGFCPCREDSFERLSAVEAGLEQACLCDSAACLGSAPSARSEPGVIVRVAGVFALLVALRAGVAVGPVRPSRSSGLWARRAEVLRRLEAEYRRDGDEVGAALAAGELAGIVRELEVAVSSARALSAWAPWNLFDVLGDVFAEGVVSGGPTGGGGALLSGVDGGWSEVWTFPVCAGP